MTRHFKTWRWAATLAVAVLAKAAALGQEPAVDLQAGVEATALDDGYPADPAFVEPGVVEPTVVEAYGPELSHGGPPVIDGQPVNWISGPYLKAGVAFGFTDSPLDNQDPGYTISAGFRQPLSPALDERLFLDLGGSYLSVFGNTTRNSSGFQTPLAGDPTIVPNAFSTTLDEVQRAGVHTAVGWYWGAPLDYRSNDLQLRVATRLGGRWSHVAGQFSDVQLEDPPVGGTIRTHYCESDTAGGLFVGTEVMLLNRDWAGGSIQWTLDGEIGNDWVNFEGFNSGSLGTASIMTGFMFSR